MSNLLIDIKKIDRAALIRADGIVPWLLMDDGGLNGSGRLLPVEFDYKTGDWINNRTGSTGNGVVCLYAELKNISPYEASIRVARCLGVFYV